MRVLTDDGHSVASFVDVLRMQGVEVAEAERALAEDSLLKSIPVLWDDWLPADRTRTVCGAYHFRRGCGFVVHDRIALRPDLEVVLPAAPLLLAVREVFLHELAHALAPYDKHGEQWAEATERLGLVCPGEQWIPWERIIETAKKEPKRWKRND